MSLGVADSESEWVLFVSSISTSLELLVVVVEVGALIVSAGLESMFKVEEVETGGSFVVFAVAAGVANLCLRPDTIQQHVAVMEIKYQACYSMNIKKTLFTCREHARTCIILS